MFLTISTAMMQMLSFIPEIFLTSATGLDDDCDGVVDENGIYVRYFKDADGDGYGKYRQR
jgi:hypothetical protein